jgi:hypothetical protein
LAAVREVWAKNPIPTKDPDPYIQEMIDRVKQLPEEQRDRFELKWIGKEKDCHGNDLETQTDGLPEIRESWSKLAEAEIKEPAETVKGLVHAGSKAAIASGSKAGKTWSLMDLGFSIASGTEFHGRPCKQSRVLFINLELMEYFFRYRGGLIQNAKSFSMVHYCGQSRNPSSR